MELVIVISVIYAVVATFYALDKRSENTRLHEMLSSERHAKIAAQDKAMESQGKLRDAEAWKKVVKRRGYTVPRTLFEQRQQDGLIDTQIWADNLSSRYPGLQIDVEQEHQIH